MTDREKIHWLLWGVVAIAAIYLTLPPLPKTASRSSTAVPFPLLLETIRNGDAPPVYPAGLVALDGRRVTISGFATPYDDPQTAAKLLLSEGGGGCYFCAPPGANGVVLVRRASKAPLSLWQNEPLTFEGTLHLTRADSTDEEAGRFLFTLDDAGLVRNEDLRMPASAAKGSL
ncbi:MAG: DUF3299 domain-containing protein [Luteolibacter sp.]